MRVVRNHLKLGVGNVPRLVTCRLLQKLLVVSLSIAAHIPVQMSIVIYLHVSSGLKNRVQHFESDSFVLN